MNYFINFSFILIYLVEKKQPMSQLTPQAISLVWKLFEAKHTLFNYKSNFGKIFIHFYSLMD